MCIRDRGRGKAAPGLDLSPGQMLRTRQYWLGAGAVYCSSPEVLLISPIILLAGPAGLQLLDGIFQGRIVVVAVLELKLLRLQHFRAQPRPDKLFRRHTVIGDEPQHGMTRKFVQARFGPM